MKHIRKIILVAVCLMFTATTLVSAFSYSTTVKLYEKDPDGIDNIPGTKDDWSIVQGGAQGTFYFGQRSVTRMGLPVILKNYLLLSSGLTSNTAYTVVCYPAENYPHAQYIGAGVTNSIGSMILTGSYATTPTYKLWVVLSSDFDPINQVFIGWHPTEYLFEENIF